MFMVGHLCKQCHGFNGLFARWMRIPSTPRQVFTRQCRPSQDSHRHDEVHMHARKPCLAIRRFSVQHEQTVELVRIKAGCNHGFESINDGVQLCFAGLLSQSECQTTAGVLVLPGNAIDKPDGQPWVALQNFRAFRPELTCMVMRSQQVVDRRLTAGLPGPEKTHNHCAPFGVALAFLQSASAYSMISAKVCLISSSSCPPLFRWRAI